MRDIVKRNKYLETQIEKVQNQYDMVTESMKDSFAGLKKQLADSQAKTKELKVKLQAASETGKKIIELTETLKARDLTIDAMVPQLEKLKSDYYTANRHLKSSQEDLNIKVAHLEELRKECDYHNIEKISTLQTKMKLEQQIEKM